MGGVPPTSGLGAPPPSPSRAPLLIGVLGCSALLLLCVVLAGAWAITSRWKESPLVAPVAPTMPAPVAPGAPTPGAPSAPVQPIAPPAPPSPLGFSSIACPMVDSTGDGVLEIGGVITRGDRRIRPAMLDGASGEVIWEAAPLDESDKRLICLGPRHLGVIDQRAFELTIFPATGIEGEVRRSLSDELDSFSLGEGCVTLRTEDARTVSISLADASDVSCSAGRRIRPHLAKENTVGFVHGIYSMLRPFEISHEGTVYTLRTRRPGTPLLEVSATQGGRERWSRAVHLLPVGGDAIGYLAGAAGPGVVVVTGEERDKDFFSNTMYLVGLDATTGAERYRLATEGSGISGMFNNGRYIITATGRRLVALEPASGEIAWQHAGR